ncbi:alpha-N-acetylgalactosamine-specific lectin-like [Branchiostoma floridae x Branchiostoma japonicum]
MATALLTGGKETKKRLQTLSCPEGYAKFRGICYKAFNTVKTFSGAAAACGEDGGTLAMPRDAETNAFLISLYKSVSAKRAFWFGLHDRRVEGSFEWVDGSALGTYTFWAPRQPNNTWGKQHCVSYNSSSKDKWNDGQCDIAYRFICQAAPGRP